MHVDPSATTGARWEGCRPQWVTSCARCTREVPDGGGDLDLGGYAIELERIRTWAQVIWWTDHLSWKGWYDRSGWRDLLGRNGLPCPPEPGLERDLELEAIHAEWEATGGGPMPLGVLFGETSVKDARARMSGLVSVSGVGDTQTGGEQ